MICDVSATSNGTAPGGAGAAGCPLEGVEDQAGADPEPVSVVVAGLEDVPDGQLGEVG